MLFVVLIALLRHFAVKIHHERRTDRSFWTALIAFSDNRAQFTNKYRLEPKLTVNLHFLVLLNRSLLEDLVIKMDSKWVLLKVGGAYLPYKLSILHSAI